MVGMKLHPYFLPLCIGNYTVKWRVHYIVHNPQATELYRASFVSFWLDFDREQKNGVLHSSMCLWFTMKKWSNSPIYITYKCTHTYIDVTFQEISDKKKQLQEKLNSVSR